MTDTTNEFDARSQAKAQADSIAEMVAALQCDYDRLQELRDDRDALQADLADAKENDPARAEDAANALAEWHTDNDDELADLASAAGECESQDEAQTRIAEDALSVEVRSDWAAPGEEMTPAEFRIVLCTGGPHVEMRGELNEHGEPTHAYLMFQDWGTPLTEYSGAGIERDTLLAYASQFLGG